MAIKVKVGDHARFVNLFYNWAHQAFFYLDTTEMIGHLIFETFLILIMVITVSYVVSIHFLNMWSIILCFIFVHTLSWIFNGNWWACMLFAFPHLRNPGEKATCRYLNRMAERLKKDSSISGVLIFGSLSRSTWHDRSDIDLRILRKSGFKNALSALFVQFRERLIALFSKQPLDMYLADDVAFLRKMRSDENPVILLMEDSRLKDMYPHSREGFLRKCNVV